MKRVFGFLSSTSTKQYSSIRNEGYRYIVYIVWLAGWLLTPRWGNSDLDGCEVHKVRWIDFFAIRSRSNCSGTPVVDGREEIGKICVSPFDASS